jgi:hypothetical protein
MPAILALVRSQIKVANLWGNLSTYGLRDIVYNNGTVGISVVHGSQRLVSLLAGGIPNLELDRRVLIEGDGLSEESRSNGGFSEGVELILTASLATPSRRLHGIGCAAYLDKTKDY